MRFLYILLFISFLFVLSAARAEPPESDVPAIAPSHKAGIHLAEILAHLQSGTGFNYESSKVDGAIVEFTNVSSRTDPKFQFESIRVSNPYLGSAENRSTFSIELVGASVDGANIAVGFDRLFLEMPAETVSTMIQLLSENPEHDLLLVLRTLQLDTLEIQGAYLLDEDCDIRLGALKIAELANLATSLLNLERIGIACEGEEVAFQFNVPYVYIDDLTLGAYVYLEDLTWHSVYLKNLSRGFDPYILLLGIARSDPVRYLAESIRVSDVSANLDGVIIEADAVSFSSSNVAGRNHFVSSMTPLNVRLTVGQKDSDFANPVRDLFDLIEISELKLEYRQEHYFDIDNDRFSLPLNDNYIEVNDLARINFELELEGMASYLEGTESVIARGGNSEDFPESDELPVHSNLKLLKLGFDVADYGLVDHAFQVASHHYGQPPDMLKGTVALLLATLASNSDLRLKPEEEKRFLEIVDVLSVALRNRGTLSARFEIDDDWHDLKEEDRLRKMILEFMTIEFVE